MRSSKDPQLPREPSSFAPTLLTDRQQLAAGGILFVCLVVMLGIAITRQFRGDRLINIERPFTPRRIEFRIDVNEAEWPELTLLPEVSETLARRIIEFREEQGRFESLDELQQVRGIGPRTLEQIQPYLEPLGPSEVSGDVNPSRLAKSIVSE